MVTSRPIRSTPCALPHFTKAGEPRGVPGQVYRWETGWQVLCVQHGKELIARIAAEAGS